MSMKIATFNVNSVKSRLPILDKWLKSDRAPDILCLQETKCRDEEFPTDFFNELGYQCCFKGMKSYNGVAVASRIPFVDFFCGLDDDGEAGREEQEAARTLFVRFENFSLFNSYVPQGKEITHDDYPYKLRFFKRIYNLFNKHCLNTDRLLWVGDLNVAPTNYDVANPKNKQEHVCFHSDVKDALASVMEWGLVDIFRIFLIGDGHYTFWDYRVKNALERNIGWRIDHILGTQSIAACCKDVYVERELRAMERPSDHTAVVASFDI